MIGTIFRAGLEAARAAFTAAREAAAAAGSPHLPPAPELAATDRQLYGPRPGDLVVYGWHDGKPGHVGILSFVPGWVGEEPASVIEARKWVGLARYRYGLGHGGRNPLDGTPFDAEDKCDCSGFVCHCLKIDRKDGDRWWNTTAIRADSLTPGGEWDPVPLFGVDLRRCRAIHCHGGKPPPVSETSAALWHERGVVARLRTA